MDGVRLLMGFITAYLDGYRKGMDAITYGRSRPSKSHLRDEVRRLNQVVGYFTCSADERGFNAGQAAAYRDVLRGDLTWFQIGPEDPVDWEAVESRSLEEVL